MTAWLGPALIAAIVSGLVSVLGWFATFYISLRRDQMLRDEKVYDFQVALRAEIVSDVLSLSRNDMGRYLAEARERYAKEAGYSVLVPRIARNPIFNSLLGEIQILPSDIIEPVVKYERMRETIEQFVEDLRDDSFKAMPPSRQLLMYSDYLDMLSTLKQLAGAAEAALAASLNIPGADHAILPVASAGDEARASKHD